MATRPPRSTRRPTEELASIDSTVRVEDRRDPATRSDGATRDEPATRRDPTAGPVVLDRYRLHRRLGTGGFGTVWHARDERLERDVAVKLLPRERIVGGRFEREARAAARLSHPGIVTLYEAAVDDDGAYLVSELIRGATLGELLDAGRLSDRDVVRIGIALCDALIHAHTQGVVHRDVKPSNILVPEQPATPAQIAKLTDFGVARIIGGDTLTRTGDVIGTMAYMAPEQAEGLEAGAPADLYSLALVLYEALTGRNPVGTGTAARRARRLGAYLPPIRRQRRDLPRELGYAIDLALRPRARERGSVEELRGALQASLGEVQDRPGVIGDPWPSRTSARRAEQPLAHRAEHPLAHRAGDQLAPRAGAVSPAAQDDLEAEGRPPIPWPERMLAAAVAAGVAAWLAGSVLAPGSVNPAIAAALAAAAVGALPRVGWLALIAAAAGALAADGRPGAMPLVVLAGLAAPLLLPLEPARWPLPAVAPALGAIGLAGAWPALAGRATSAWQRAALGASGWLVLVAAETLTTTDLYVRMPPAVAARSAWEPSLYDSLHHALLPLASTGVLAPALAWGFAAAVLPWMTAFRSLPVKLVLVTVWTAATASAVTTALHAAHAGALVRPEVAVLGAVAAGIVALAPSIPAAIARRGWADRSRTGLA